MKEHTDDVLSSVKESTATVDSTSTDEIVTRREKIKGIFGERVDRDDVMVDVETGDAGVDNHGDTKIDSDEKSTPDQVNEDVAVAKEVNDDLAESKAVSLQKIEVVKEVIQDSDDPKSENGLVVKDSKLANEPLKPSSKELEASEGETEVSEPVQVVADKDLAVEEKTTVLSSSKIPESIDSRVETVEESLVSKDKGEDGVNNQSSLTKVDQTINEGFQLTNEATTNDGKKSETDDSNMVVESVNEEPKMNKEDCVKDEDLDSKKIIESPTVVDEITDHENAKNLDQNAEVEVDQVSKETTEVGTENASKSEDSKMDDETQVNAGEIDAKDENEDPERGLIEETVKQDVGDEDHVNDEKIVKVDVINSSKVSQSLTMANLGLEDVDVVVVDESLESKNEAKDGVSVELSLVFPDNKKNEVDPKTEVDPKAEVDPTSKDENSNATKVIEEPNSDVQVSTDVTVISKPEPESSNGKMTPVITNEVVATDTVIQISDPETTTVDGNSSNFQENQGLVPNQSNETTGGPDSYSAHQFSYEGHTDRGDDAGMDIDEVLGWKDETHSDDGSKKRKAVDAETAEGKPSFKVGSVIQKMSSQPVDHVTGNQAHMLSQLQLTAQDPMKLHGFINTIIPFFKNHRANVGLNLNLSSSGRKRKPSNENEVDEFEFDDVNDSYWTDRVIQNQPEEHAPPNNNNNNSTGVVEHEHQIVTYGQEKPIVKPARRSNKKRFFNSNHEIEANEQSEIIARRQQNLATEVLMKFASGVYFPSEIHLNKMFKRFGPLMESETEVDRQSGRARVVFKKCSDAEVAHSSAGKFSIFGSISVNYELNYTPLISYKPLPLPMSQDPAW